jgi:hypothetical protein
MKGPGHDQTSNISESTLLSAASLNHHGEISAFSDNIIERTSLADLVYIICYTILCVLGPHSTILERRRFLHPSIAKLSATVSLQKLLSTRYQSLDYHVHIPED